MKTRIIVAFLGIPFLFLMIFFAPLWAFALALGLISAIAAYEILRCMSPASPERFRAYAVISALSVQVANAFETGSLVLYAAIFLLTLVMFVELMISFRKESQVRFEIVLQVIFAGTVMPALLSSLVRVGLNDNSSIYLLLPFVAAFSSDSGAYFAGSFLGKRKLFPNLSPNKTLEGCIGGFAAAIGVMILYGIILRAIGVPFVNFTALVLYGFLGSLACQLGDLAFSAVKRVYKIKDFGTLIPGHGGVLDRFDSMHFTAPMIEILVLLLPAFV